MMPDKRLVDYIKREKFKGNTFDQIKKNLIKKGYHNNYIDESILLIKKLNKSSKKIGIIQFFEKIKKICFYPKKFFQELPEEERFIDALKYYFILVLIISPFGFILALISEKIQVDLGTDYFAILGTSFFSKIGNYYLILILSLIFFVCVVSIWHLSALMFGAKKGIKATYIIFLYGSTPSLILGWMPILNIFSFFYSIYIFIIGLNIRQKLNITKAVLSYSCAFLFVLFLSISFIFYLTTLWTYEEIIGIQEVRDSYELKLAECQEYRYLFEYEEEISCYNQALGYFENFTWVYENEEYSNYFGFSMIYRNKAIAYSYLGDHEKAIENFDLALSFDPNNLEIINMREEIINQDLGSFLDQ